MEDCGNIDFEKDQLISNTQEDHFVSNTQKIIKISNEQFTIDELFEMFGGDKECVTQLFI